MGQFVGFDLLKISHSDISNFCRANLIMDFGSSFLSKLGIGRKLIARRSSSNEARNSNHSITSSTTEAKVPAEMRLSIPISRPASHHRWRFSSPDTRRCSLVHINSFNSRSLVITSSNLCFQFSSRKASRFCIDCMSGCAASASLSCLSN